MDNLEHQYQEADSTPKIDKNLCLNGVRYVKGIMIDNAIVTSKAKPTSLGRNGQRLPAIPKNISDPRLDHIAVWTEDLERTSKFLTEVLGWRRPSLEFGVADESTVFGGMKLIFIDANGLWLELIQPTTPGPGMDFLKEKGNGALVELDFGGIKDFNQNIVEMKARGIDLIGMDNKPLKDDGLLLLKIMADGKHIHGSEKLSYLPLDVSCGTVIELYWEYSNGIVLLRNKMSEETKQPQTSPRLDHVVVLATDLSKTVNLYTDVLNLNRSPMEDSLSRNWMNLDGGSNIWIEGGQDSIWINIVAPKARTSSSILLDKRLGEGAIVELAIEVPNIDAFYDQMQLKGITMTAGDATPLPAGEKSVIVNLTGDRYSYFPLDKSEGMRILVFQRSASSKSAFNRRDATRTH